VGKQSSYVYILASRSAGTLYVGVTTNLISRVAQHREGLVEGFTKKYRVCLLVYFETHDSIEAAITREKRLKRWNRAWKIRLIEQTNSEWRDLYTEITAF
jgi:putative endonuclease